MPGLLKFPLNALVRHNPHQCYQQIEPVRHPRIEPRERNGEEMVGITAIRVCPTQAVVKGSSESQKSKCRLAHKILALTRVTAWNK